MRSSSTIAACLLAIPLVVLADTAGLLTPKPTVSQPGGNQVNNPSSISGGNSVAPSESTPTSTSINTSLQDSSTTTKIDISSSSTSTSLPSSSSILIDTSPSSSNKEIASTTTTPVESTSAMSSSPSFLTENQSSKRHRDLIIILSSVLGFFGLALIASGLFLWHRYHQGRSPFGGHRRGASPIGDDEIASWRRHAEERKIPPVTPDPRTLSSHVKPIPLAHSHGWAWEASPTSIRTISVSVPDSPSFLAAAKAPNSRIGLTDETVPGADPFLPPVKRQSSRLSKQRPNGHSREKSRKSSMSGKSSWSMSMNGQNDDRNPLSKVIRQDRLSTWYDPGTKEERNTPRITSWFNPEDEEVNERMKELENGSDTPGTSIFNELNEISGGLSPRPKSRSRTRKWPDIEKDEIGRALG